MNKDEVRSQMRRMRRALSAEAQREAEDAVFARISALSAYRRARTVMAYAAARAVADGVGHYNPLFILSLIHI